VELGDRLPSLFRLDVQGLFGLDDWGRGEVAKRAMGPSLRRVQERIRLQGSVSAPRITCQFGRATLTLDIVRGLDNEVLEGEWGAYECGGCSYDVVLW
jgi:hypothetical protein